MTGFIRSCIYDCLFINTNNQSTKRKWVEKLIKIVGNNIKQIIKEKNLIVRHIAHDADLDIEALRRYMLGKQIMGIDKLIRISKALNVEISELFREI